MLSMTGSGEILTDQEARVLKHVSDEDWCDVLAYPCALVTAAKYGTTPEDIADMGQLAVMTIWRNRPRVDAAASPIGYAMSIARSACLNWLEREKAKRDKVRRAILERVLDE